MRRAIAALPSPLKETLVLREINGLDYREIAEATETPIGTVMSRLARARAAIAKCWERSNDRLRQRARSDASLRVNAALDDEFDAAQRLGLSANSGRSRSFGRSIAATGAGSEAVRRAAPRERAPAELRARVSRFAEDREVRPSRAIRVANWPRAIAASLAAIAVIGALAWAFSHRADRRRPAIASAGLGLHARAGFRSAVRRRLFGPSHREAVAARRVTLGARSRRPCRGKGYPLAGGRIDIVGRDAGPDAGLSAGASTSSA